MEKRKNNKGFTLVELIVVLVILAILAAILVPALLGYIDRAKGQQIVLNAKSVLTASQAELSSCYASAKSTDTAASMLSANSDARKTTIQNTADVPGTYSIKVKGTTGHDAWTVGEVYYTENGKSIHYDGSTWEEETVDTSGSGWIKIK
jgi:prepilin-type N-terminal cleavage/methylation domain-containing protein